MSENIFVVSMRLIAEPTPGDSPWEVEFERVVDAFYELEQGDGELLDSAWSSSDRYDHALVDVEVTVHAETADQAWAKASGSVRCAIHAAGGRTPGWYDLDGDKGPAFIVMSHRDVEAVPA